MNPVNINLQEQLANKRQIDNIIGAEIKLTLEPLFVPVEIRHAMTAGLIGILLFAGPICLVCAKAFSFCYSCTVKKEYEEVDTVKSTKGK